MIVPLIVCPACGVAFGLVTTIRMMAAVRRGEKVSLHPACEERIAPTTQNSAAERPN